MGATSIMLPIVHYERKAEVGTFFSTKLTTETVAIQEAKFALSNF